MVSDIKLRVALDIVTSGSSSALSLDIPGEVMAVKTRTYQLSAPAGVPAISKCRGALMGCMEVGDRS